MEALRKRNGECKTIKLKISMKLITKYIYMKYFHLRWFSVILKLPTLDHCMHCMCNRYSIWRLCATTNTTNTKYKFEMIETYNFDKTTSSALSFTSREWFELLLLVDAVFFLWFEYVTTDLTHNINKIYLKNLDLLSLLYHLN